MLRAALQLAKRGLAVFPCMARDKRPATPNGLKDATTDPTIIGRWWQQLPDANVAVATGMASGFFAVDIDAEDAETELRKLEAQHGALPATVEVITARGRHVYFRMPAAAVRNSAGKVAPGIDVRGDGGYVLAPPSMHPSGRRYCWSVDSGHGIAAAPGWLLAKIEAPAGNGTTPSAEWHALVAEGVAEGARDCSVAKLAGYLLRRRVDPVIALELLHMWNSIRCTPPLPACDIERIVGSIAGRELRRRASA